MRAAALTRILGEERLATSATRRHYAQTTPGPGGEYCIKTPIRSSNQAVRGPRPAGSEWRAMVRQMETGRGLSRQIYPQRQMQRSRESLACLLAAVATGRRHRLLQLLLLLLLQGMIKGSSPLGAPRHGNDGVAHANASVTCEWPACRPQLRSTSTANDVQALDQVPSRQRAACLPCPCTDGGAASSPSTLRRQAAITGGVIACKAALDTAHCRCGDITAGIHGPYPWKRSIVSGCAAHRPPTAFVRELWRNALQPDLAPSHATESFGGSSFSFSPTKKTRGPPTTPATMAVADLLPLSWCRHPAVIVHLRHAACWVARGSPAVILSAGAVAVADSASKPRRIRRRGRRRRE